MLYSLPEGIIPRLFCLLCCCCFFGCYGVYHATLDVKRVSNLGFARNCRKKKQIFRCIPYRFPKWWIEPCVFSKKMPTQQIQEIRGNPWKSVEILDSLNDAHTLSPNQLQKLIVALFLGTGTERRASKHTTWKNTQPLKGYVITNYGMLAILGFYDALCYA